MIQKSQTPGKPAELGSGCPKGALSMIALRAPRSLCEPRSAIARAPAPAQATPAVSSFVVANHLVAPMPLGRMEAIVGAPHQIPRPFALPIAGDAARYGYPAHALAGGALDELDAHDLTAHVIGDRQGRAQLNLGKDYPKLLATDPCGNVVSLKMLLERMR